MLPKELDHEDGELTATQKVQALRDRRRSSTTSSTTCTAKVADDRVRREPRCAGWASAASTRCWRSGFVIIYKATRVISFAQPAFMLAGAVLVSLPGRRRSASSSALPLAALLTGGAGAGRRAGRGAADDRPAGVRGRHHHARRRRRRPGRRQRVHRHRRAPGRRPVGAGHRSRSVGSTMQQRHLAMLRHHGRARRRCCSRSSATPGWAWRCGRPPTTRRPRWPRASRSARCSPCPGRSPARSPRSAARSRRPAAASTRTLWIIALVALPVIILGGLDSLPGAVVGGLLVGVVQELVAHLPAQLAAVAGRQLLGHHPVRADADRAAGAPVRPVRHPGGRAGMTTRRAGAAAALHVVRAEWRCSTRGPRQVRRVAVAAGCSALGAAVRAAPTTCCSCSRPAASRRSARSGSAWSPATPGQVSLGHAFFLGVGAYTAAVDQRRPGRPHDRLRHHQHPGLAAGRRPRRRARRRARGAAGHPAARAVPGDRHARPGLHRRAHLQRVDRRSPAASGVGRAGRRCRSCSATALDGTGTRPHPRPEAVSG